MFAAIEGCNDTITDSEVDARTNTTNIRSHPCLQQSKEHEKQALMHQML